MLVRLSLDTMAVDSDGDEDEVEHNGPFQSTQQKTDCCIACPLEETDGPKERLSSPTPKVQWLILCHVNVANF